MSCTGGTSKGGTKKHTPSNTPKEFDSSYIYHPILLKPTFLKEWLPTWEQFPEFSLPAAGMFMFLALSAAWEMDSRSLQSGTWRLL